LADRRCSFASPVCSARLGDHPRSQGSSTACEMLRGSRQRKGRFGPAVGLLAGALQVVWIPALSPSCGLSCRLGRFGQPPVRLDQYPTGQSDHAGKQGEHPSEREQVQEKSHGAFCRPRHSGSVSCSLAPDPADHRDHPFHHGSPVPNSRSREPDQRSSATALALRSAAPANPLAESVQPCHLLIVISLQVPTAGNNSAISIEWPKNPARRRSIRREWLREWVRRPHNGFFAAKSPRRRLRQWVVRTAGAPGNEIKERFRAPRTGTRAGPRRQHIS
jgi:hypothetical protein